MTLVLLLTVLGAGTGSSVSLAPRWETIYQTTGTKDWLSSIWAADRDDWFVAGSWGVTHVRKDEADRKETPGKGILGVFGESANSVFAMGTDELVLHFDGKGWLQEHIGSNPKRRPARGGDLLHSAFYLPDGPHTLGVFGPDLVLERQADGTWMRPPAQEMERLSLLADTGPVERPPKCARDSWFWLGKDRAWFTCKDRRTFIYDAGQTIAKGRKPASCPTLTRVAYGDGEIYLICDERGVWKTSGQEWRALPRPDGPDTDYRSISFAGGCLFLAGRRTVWRSCAP